MSGPPAEAAPSQSWADAVETTTKRRRRGRRVAKKGEWAVITRDGVRRALPTVPEIPTTIAEEQLLFRLGSVNEAGFVVGAGGRNTGLVLKTTGVAVTVAASNDVLGAPRRADADIAYATRMAFSRAAGGVLRWFVTPQATARGFPPDQQDALRRLAETQGCDLLLLQSKRGHMCLLLVLRAFVVDAEDRARMRAARELLLAALAPLESVSTKAAE